MYRSLLKGTVLAIALAGSVAAAQSASDYPLAWLEEIEGEKALNWARAENAKTLGVLEADPRFAKFQARALDILQAQDRIPFVSIRPDGLYNFWQDRTNVRGLWRRTTLASYRTANPVWETVLDIDALAKAENANWVFQGASCLPPDYRRCLLSLSDGGKDANVVREFDTATKSFVAGGFSLPEGKQVASWVDQDTLLVARDWGPGTMTKSGYAFVVKELKRGQKLDQARELFRGSPDDTWTWPMVVRDNRGVVHAIGAMRGLNFFDSEYVLFTPKGPVKLPVPKKSSPSAVVDGRLLLTIREDWTPPGGAAFKAGALVSYDLAEWKRDPLKARPSLVFQPTDRQTLRGVATTRNALILTILDNVRGKAFTYNYAGGAWKARPVDLPRNATIGVTAASDTDDLAMFSVTDYLTPTTLSLYDAGSGRIEPLKASPARFDASKHTIDQFEAVSRDGTKIPYFLVRPKTMKRDGSTPTLLYGYGGFEVSQVPNYSGPMGALWLEQGNAYVVANLRGGGEFGPAWHQSAQGANKQRTWDDYIAVAEDLVKRRITSPRRLGVVGGSQGGLLVGTAITQRPDLFNAAIVQVPLFDMLRYHKMSAGASWIGEYGDPEIPEQRAWLAAYSPLQRLTPGRKYPTPFILTSTKDDRVHPAHGRKAAARLAELGQPYYYYENIDGGHSAAANLKEAARRTALEYTYATKQLVD
ncbi:prolyl oligopeptidase family serine peptidase [Sphingomonas mesophila]|uniref:prolyl oligopeptidase family serine peptidase n=1 Tax=Sphingomonas mesophila TaxID=2303576 RepID=UPI000E56EF95|nr:prolyl oligopeptidase family serine peptidase [Sphingomonas mesophila]